jgi:uncharacterized protein
MLQISQIFVYPIKSMGGVEIFNADITDRGIKFDRRWMLVDDKYAFITQREFPQLSLLKVRIENDGLRVIDEYSNSPDLLVPFMGFSGSPFKVSIWNAICDAVATDKLIDQWFSDILKIKCRLVFMPDETMRPVDTTSGFAPQGKFTSFADAYPFLLLGQESLNDLNSKLVNPVSITRFRPNLVFSGGHPYQEDEIEKFEINGVKFLGLENCARCSIISINQENATRSKEPIKTLSTFRKRGNDIHFGRNVVHTGTGTVSVGDQLLLPQ